MSVKVRCLAAWWMMAFLSWVSLAVAAGEPQLVEAVKSGDRAAVRMLLRQNVDVNAASGDGATALHWAVRREDLETVDLLIRGGAAVNVANDFGVTPLGIACTNGSAALVKKLLEASANPNAATSMGETLLMTCARSAIDHERSTSRRTAGARANQLGARLTF